MDARDYEDAYLREEAELLSALGTVKQEPGAWVGCGECDCEFPCYHGKTTCLRLPTEKQEPVGCPDLGDVKEFKEMLAQAEKQEPVKDAPVAWRFSKGTITKLDSCPHGGNWQPLYIHPQPDLTEEVEFMQGKYEEMLAEWLPQKQRIAALEEAAREARDALQYHTSQTRPIFNTVEAILTLDAVLGNAEVNGG